MHDTSLSIMLLSVKPDWPSLTVVNCVHDSPSPPTTPHASTVYLYWKADLPVHLLVLMDHKLPWFEHLWCYFHASVQSGQNIQRSAKQ